MLVLIFTFSSIVSIVSWPEENDYNNIDYNLKKNLFLLLSSVYNFFS